MEPQLTRLSQPSEVCVSMITLVSDLMIGDSDYDNLSLLSVLQEICILLTDVDSAVLDGVQDVHH